VPIDTKPGYTHLIMLGTAARGGILSVIEAWRARGLFERWPVEFLPTHCEGGRLRKAVAALRALCGVVLAMLKHGSVILHVHAASDASFWRKAIFMSVGMLGGARVIFHLHGGRFARFYEEECGALRRRAIRFFLERADCIIVLSDSWREWVSTVSRNPRVVCIPNPVLEPAEPTLPPSRSTILFLGLISREKGIFDLLEAVAAVRAAVPDVRLVCAGDGDIAAAAEHARRLGISDAVAFPGWLSGAQKDACLQRASVFALPSYAEGMPMSLLEAMAAGIPAVASAVGSVPEVIADGVNGFLIAPGDTGSLERRLCRLLCDGALRSRIAEAGRETVRNRFGADNVVAALERLYIAEGLVPRHAAALRDTARRPAREAA
jgi:glycosyltransferase involved in cell wall biosynthesis